MATAPKHSEAAPEKKPVGFSIDDFRAKHDRSFIVPNAIREGLRKLGAKAWMYEMDFMKLCGVAANEFARHREPFLGYTALVPSQGTNGNKKRIWAGSEEFAAELRAITEQ